MVQEMESNDDSYYDKKIVGMVMYDFVLVMDDTDLVKNGVILVMNDGLNQC